MDASPNGINVGKMIIFFVLFLAAFAHVTATETSNDSAVVDRSLSKVKNWVRATMPVLNTAANEQKLGTDSVSRKGNLRKTNSFVSISPRIVRGKLARRGDFPYIVGIVMDDVSFCGGSLISRKHVLTAAHCIKGYNSFSLIFGAQTRDKNEKGTAARRSTSKVFHRQYNMDTMKNDIGIIYLERQVEISGFIKLVKLATKSQTGRILKRGTVVSVAGWGKTSDSADVSQTLKTTDLQVQSRTLCSKTYGSGSFTNSHICAQGKNGDATCQGDSGGPLMVMDNQLGEMVQVGLVSYGSARGCSSRDPEVFTRVASFDKWIAANCDNC